MRSHALRIAAAIARAASPKPTFAVLATSLGLVLALCGCWSSHGQSAVITPSDGGGTAIDAGQSALDGGPAPIDLDGDGYPAGVDCDDGNAAIHPGAAEYECGLDGVDQDCDGFDFDEECEADPDCLAWLCNG